MRFIQWNIIGCSLFLVALTGFLSVLRQKPSTAEWIAFASNRSGIWEVYLMEPDGDNIHPITHKEWINGDEFPASLQWRGSTTKLDFLTVNPGERYTHYILDAHTQKRYEYKYPIEFFRPLDWSKDGEWVAYVQATESGQFWLYRMHPDGSAKSAITNLGLNSTGPTFSPDGEWIAVAYGDEEQSDLAKVRVNGTDFQILVQGLPYISVPQWSADGEWLVFSVYQGENNDIYRVRRDGSDLTNITHDAEASQFMPTFSPDGEWIAYIAYDEIGVPKLFKMRVDGSKVEELAPSAWENFSPAWSPRFDSPWHGHFLAIGGLVGMGLGSLIPHLIGVKLRKTAL